MAGCGETPTIARQQGFWLCGGRQENLDNIRTLER
jgi:hypothetical protein